MAIWVEFEKTMIAEPSVFDDARSGNVDGLKKYLDLGGECDVRNHKGHTPLMMAAHNNHLEACTLLINRGANINAIDNLGNSIMMGICFKGNSQIAQLFLEKGVDLERRNYNGSDAFEMATSFARQDILLLFEEDGKQGDRSRS